ncbi:neprilysin-1-like [Glandiceps talaboti]
MTTDDKDGKAVNKSSEAIRYKPSTSAENGDAILFRDETNRALGPLICKAWWKRRTPVEKSLGLLLGFVACVCIILIIVLAIQLGSLTSNKSNNVCTSSSCVRTASELLKKMDQSVDPCQDFYQYTCGSWNKQNYIPEDQSVYDIFTEMRDKVELTGRRLLEYDSSGFQAEFITKAKTFYRSCLDEAQIERNGATLIVKAIHNLGGWPVMEDNVWNERSWQLVDVLGTLRLEYDTRVMLDMWTAEDDKDSDTNIIYVDQPTFGMPSRDYFLKNSTGKYLTAYLDYMVQIATKLRSDGNEEIARREMTKVLEFETKMAENSVPKADRRDVELLYNKMTIKQLNEEITQFDWMAFLQTTTPGVHLDQYESIVNYSPDYLREFGTLIETTPKRTIANYVIWDFISKNVAYLSEEFRTVRQNFRKAMFGEKTERERWRQCVSQTTGALGMAVGALFVKDNFNEDSRTTALEMIADIRESFRTMLREVDWMDGETKILAEEKADAIIERIGYPDYLLDPKVMNEEYKDIVISRDNFFENVLAIYKWSANNALSKLREAVDKEKWKTTPATVNAFYNPSRNEIVFPAGILQPPFYSKEHPKSMNYGGIGMVIGHEITHGFDDRGRQYDKNGNWHQWWSEKSVNNFKQKAQCIVDQYSNYTVPEIKLNINGVQTQGENIADNGGIKEAFMAYRRWVQRNGKEEQPLPGINLTHNQLFFVNFGQLWCGLATDEYLTNFLSSAWHSPRFFRVLGSVSNSPDFAKAFGCKKNAPMNPDKKCSVW